MLLMNCTLVICKYKYVFLTCNIYIFYICKVSYILLYKYMTTETFFIDSSHDFFFLNCA